MDVLLGGVALFALMAVIGEVYERWLARDEAVK